MRRLPLRLRYGYIAFYCSACGALHEILPEGLLESFALVRSVLICYKSSVFSGEQIIWQKWGIHISVESIQAALVLTSGVLAFCGAVIMFVQTTEWCDLTYALEKNGLSHTASFVILSSFQTISDLGVNAHVIMDSQKARGIETEGNLIQRVKAYIPVMGPLVLNAISSVEEKSIAMERKGVFLRRELIHILWNYRK